MCGIAGIYGKNNSKSTIKGMLKKIKHRGPDDIGIHKNTSGIIGMNRLMIRSHKTDLIPFSYDNDKFVSYNGEVYALHTINLSETVLVHGGPDEVTAILKEQNYIPDGMYSLALLKKNGLKLIRDKYGIKPLFYFSTKDNIYFCSEISPLLSLENKNNYVDKNIIDEYLLLGRPITPGSTVFNNIKILPANTSLTKTKTDHYTIKQNYINDYVYDDVDKRISKKIREAINKSVKQCVLSNRNVGLALSGGVDSSILAWELNSLGIENITTISVCSTGLDDGIKNLNELQLPDNGVWRKWKHIVVHFDEVDFKKYLLKAIKCSGLPITLSSYPLYFKLAEATKNADINVLLVGEGADEIFAGYDSYHNWYQNKNKKSLGTHDRLMEFYFNNKKQELWTKLFNINRFKNVRDKFIKSLENNIPSALKYLLKTELYYSLEPLLIRTDLALMYYSVEGRTPFLHCGIPELVDLIKEHEIFNIGESKLFLKNLYPEYTRLKSIKKTPFRISKKIYSLPSTISWLIDLVQKNTYFLEKFDINISNFVSALSQNSMDDIEFEYLFKLACISHWQSVHKIEFE